MRLPFLRRLAFHDPPSMRSVKIPFTRAEMALLRQLATSQSVSIETFIRACVFPGAEPLEILEQDCRGSCP